MFLLCPFVVTAEGRATSEYEGQFVDKVLFRVIEDADNQVLALLGNRIDLIGDSIDSSLLPTTCTPVVMDFTVPPWPPQYLWYVSAAAGALSIALLLYWEVLKGGRVRPPHEVPML